MSHDDNTRFQFNCRGVQVEIAGERKYVEQMYQLLTADIAGAREAANQHNQGSGDGGDEEVVWVQRCSDMMRKIYMATPDDLAVMPLSHAVDIDKLSTVYIDKLVFDRLMPRLVDGRTLWAELTAAGRDKIKGD